MTELEQRLNYTFANPALLQEALTHRSFAHEQTPPIAHNERMELLGDAVLGVVVVSLLMTKFPVATEGELSKWRSWLVAEPTLAQIADRFQLGVAIRLGRGEAASGGTNKPRLLACALEAVVAAIFLDGGLTAAQSTITPWFTDLIAVEPADWGGDFKSQLQELVQDIHKCLPIYETVNEQGPSHNRWFVVQVRIGDVVAVGEGRSKKAAEQQAARGALAQMQAKLQGSTTDEV